MAAGNSLQCFWLTATEELLYVFLLIDIYAVAGSKRRAFKKDGHSPGDII